MRTCMLIVRRVYLFNMEFTVNLLLVLIKCVLFLKGHAAVVENELISATKIVGGYAARPNTHPYLVSMKVRFLWMRSHICGGAILKEHWILSAAHCSLDSWLLRFLPIDAVAGTTHIDKLEPTAQVARIKENIPHPLYSGGIGPYDIALFKTESPFTFTKYVQPIKLPTNENMNLKSLHVAGWGALRTTVFIPDLPSRLQEVNVTYIPYDECYRAVEGITEPGETNPLDEEAHICTGPLSGGIAACNGDSGGPLVRYIADISPPNDPVDLDSTDSYNMEDYNCSKTATTKENEPIDNKTEGDIVHREGKQHDQLIPVVVGIVSWGAAPCGMKGAPTVHTNVSTYMNFINYHLTYN